MSNCIEDLFEYDLVKKCCRCGIFFLMSDFYKYKTKRNGYRPECKICSKKNCKKYYYDNQDRLLNKQNRAKIYSDERMRRQSDFNYRLIKNTRCSINHAVNGKTKSTSTINILGIDNNTYKRWIEFQMTPNMTWENKEFDHVRPICMFDVTKDEKLKEAFS